MSPGLTLIFFLAVVVFGGGLAVFTKRERRRARTRRAVREHLVLLARRRMPLGPGLLALAREHGSDNRWRRRETEWIQGLAQKLDAQGSLVRALAAEPQLYTATQLAVLAAAEERGALPQALEILFEEEAAVRERGAQLGTLLAYPLVTTGMVLGLLLFTDVFIIPKFKAIFEVMDIELPVLTVALLDLGDFLEDYLVLLFVVSAALVALDVGLRRFGFDPRRGVWRGLGALAARVPVLGRTVRQATHGRWLARTAALLEAGSTLPEALDVARADAPGATARALARAAERAREGEPVEKVLATAFDRDATTLAPAVLLAAAEGLPQACRETARRLRERSARRLDAILRAFEFVPMLPGAVLVAAHFWGVLLPIFKLQGALIP